MLFQLYYSDSCKCCKDFKTNVWEILTKEYPNSTFEEINIDETVIDTPLKGLPTVIINDSQQIIGNMTYKRFVEKIKPED